jgi:hypothetical protein
MNSTNPLAENGTTITLKEYWKEIVDIGKVAEIQSTEIG